MSAAEMKHVQSCIFESSTLQRIHKPVLILLGGLVWECIQAHTEQFSQLISTQNDFLLCPF